MARYISETKVNIGRQKELDMAKGFAIIFMVWVHVLENTGAEITGFWPVLVDDILGGPLSAPVFMMCMGIGICYSKKNNPKSLAKRGVILLIISLLCNVTAYLIPDLIYSAIQYGEFYAYVFDDLIFADILPFAGLSFLLLAVLKKCKATGLLVFAIGIALSAIGTALRWTTAGNDILDRLLGFIWGTGNESYFPLLSWFVFPAAGYMFGTLWTRCSDKGKFYRIFTLPCVFIGGAYLAICEFKGCGLFSANSDYYYMGVLDALFIVIMAIGLFGLNYYLVCFGEKVSLYFKVMKSLSRNINAIYCIHLALLGAWELLQEFLWQKDSLSFLQVTVISLVMLIISALAAEAYSRFKNKIRN